MASSSPSLSLPPPEGAEDAVGRTLSLPPPEGGEDAVGRTLSLPPPEGGEDAVGRTLSLPQPEGGEDAVGRTQYELGRHLPNSYESIADAMDAPFDERYDTSNNQAERRRSSDAQYQEFEVVDVTDELLLVVNTNQKTSDGTPRNMESSSSFLPVEKKKAETGYESLADAMCAASLDDCQNLALAIANIGLGAVREEEEEDDKEGSAAAGRDDNDADADNAAGRMVSKSAANQTPYQIFRNSTTMSKAAKNDVENMHGRRKDGNQRKKEGIAGVAAAAADENEEDDEKYVSFAFGKNDKENGSTARSTTTPRGQQSSNAGGGANPFLSPNSVEIRQNARKLLERQPSKRRVKKKNDKNRRRSLPLQPLSSLMNIPPAASSFSKDDSQTKGSKSAFSLFSDANNQKSATNNNGKNAFGDRDIKKELEADLEEIKEAAGRVAGMASKAGGEALEAFSTGARNVIGQLWD